jgi:hypothetical protein
MKKIIELFNFLTIGAFLSAIILFIGDFFGFSLGINFQLLWRVLAGFLALTVLLNTGNIKRLLKISTTSKKFLLLSGLSLFLFALFLLFYPIFRFGSPFVWEDRIANFKAAKRIEINLNEPLKQNFQAKSNNLGTIGLKIISQDVVIEEESEEATTSAELTENEETGAVQGINIGEGELDEELDRELYFGEPERIVFRIKERGSGNYFYENTYELNQYWETDYFLFGFPVQKDSEGKNYVFEIEKTKEGETNKVFLIEEDSQGRFNFYPRYVYNLASLKTDWDPILLNISRKTNQFLEEKSNQLNLIFVFILSELLIFVFIKKEQEQFKEKLNFYLKHGFLIGLLLITISSLKFEFIQNIDYLQNVIDNLSKYSFPLTSLTIALGFLLFYFNREKIQEETEKEENEEKLAEEKRLQEFPQRFPIINRIPLLCNFIKWMYKEGWVFSIVLITVLIIFTGIKVLMPLFYTGSYIDEYYHIFSSISLFEEGKFAQFTADGILGYRRGAPITFLVGLFFSIFEKNIFWAKLVPATIGTINFILLYFILRTFIKEKIIMILTLIIYTVSPYIIFNHFYIRMYVFYEFALILTIFLFFHLIKLLRKKEKSKIIIYACILVLLNYINFRWAYDNGKYIILFVNGILFFYVYLFEMGKIPITFNNKISRNLGRSTKLNFLGKILILLLLFSVIFIALDVTEKLDFLFNASLTVAATKNNFNNFFFNTHFFYILFFLSSIVLLFVTQNIYVFILFFLSFLIFLIHAISSPDLQLTRVMFYFMPLFYFTSSFGIYSYYKILRKKILLVTIFVIIAIIGTYNIFPKDFFKKPEISGEIWYTDCLNAYKYVKNNCRNSIILSAVNQPYISVFYGVENDYFININGPYYQNYYDLASKEYYYSGTKVIEDPYDLEMILKNNEDICLIVRGSLGNKLLGKTGERMIDENLIKVEGFEKITIYKNK